MSNELAVLEQDKIGQSILKRESNFAAIFGDPTKARRFIQEAWSAFNANDFLRQCTPESLMGALYFGAQLNLPVGGPLAQFHLTPRKTYDPARKQKVWQIVPVIGYNGLQRLAMNSGEYDAVEGKVVYENDDFEEPWDDEAGTHFKLRRAKGDRGQIIGVIGRILVKGSDRSIIEYLTIDEVRKRRPSNWEKTPWRTHEAEMVKKTGVRYVAKFASKSVASAKFALAAQGDESVVTANERGELDFTHESDLVSEDWVAVAKNAASPQELIAAWNRLHDVEGEEKAKRFDQVFAQRQAELEARRG